MVVPNDESLPRHVLVLPDAARHEIACASDGLRESRVAVGKVDPLQVLEDLIAVENVKIKGACRKLWRRPQDGLCPTPGSRFVNLWETETEREQPVLLANGPGARKAKALAQPQHGFKALDGAPGCVEGLKAANSRHRPLDPEVVALDALLQVSGDVMHRRARQKAVFPGCRDRGWVGPRAVRADPVRGE